MTVYEAEKRLLETVRVFAEVYAEPYVPFKIEEHYRMVERAMKDLVEAAKQESPRTAENS
jgi:hypothetical protein